MRYWTAKLIEENFGVQIWDSTQGEVALEMADRWFQDWMCDRTLHPNP
jgi:hypothetical protein